MVLWGAFEIGEPWKPTLTHEPISIEREISSEGKSIRRPKGPLPGSGTWQRVFFGERAVSLNLLNLSGTLISGF